MIYDNEYCIRHAQRIVENQDIDNQLLVQEIAGELMRFYRLGQCSVLAPVQRALDLADSQMP
jgi:hypothetical protein